MEHMPILLAEDDEDDIFLLRHACGKVGLTNPLQVVNDGEQVLAYLRGEGRYSDRKTYPFPLLILLDLKMPKMNGLETLSAIRNDPNLHRLVVILFSSSSQESDINQAFDLRANSYLVKPATNEHMVSALSKIRDFWLRLNQYPSLPEAA
jgi:CheY-like chemotaxis protein